MSCVSSEVSDWVVTPSEGTEATTHANPVALGGDPSQYMGTASMRIPGRHDLIAQLVCVPVRLVLLVLVGENTLEPRQIFRLLSFIPIGAVVAQRELIPA